MSTSCVHGKLSTQQILSVHEHLEHPLHARRSPTRDRSVPSSLSRSDPDHHERSRSCNRAPQSIETNPLCQKISNTRHPVRNHNQWLTLTSKQSDNELGCPPKDTTIIAEDWRLHRRHTWKSSLPNATARTQDGKSPTGPDKEVTSIVRQSWLQRKISCDSHKAVTRARSTDFLPNTVSDVEREILLSVRSRSKASSPCRSTTTTDASVANVKLASSRATSIGMSLTVPNQAGSPSTEVHTWASKQSNQAIASPFSMRRRSRTIQIVLTVADLAFPKGHRLTRSRSCPPEPADVESGRDARRQGYAYVGQTTQSETARPVDHSTDQVGLAPQSAGHIRRRGHDPPRRPSNHRRHRCSRRRATKFHCVFHGADRADVTSDCATKKLYVSQLRRHHERHDFFYCEKCFKRFDTKEDQEAHPQTRDCVFQCAAESCYNYGLTIDSSSVPCQHTRENTQRDKWRRLFRMARPEEDPPDPDLEADPVLQEPLPEFGTSNDASPRSLPNIPATQNSPSAALVNVLRRFLTLAESIRPLESSMDSNSRQSIDFIGQHLSISFEQLQQIADQFGPMLGTQAAGAGLVEFGNHPPQISAITSEPFQSRRQPHRTDIPQIQQMDWDASAHHRVGPTSDPGLSAGLTSLEASNASNSPAHPAQETLLQHDQSVYSQASGYEVPIQPQIYPSYQGLSYSVGPINSEDWQTLPPHPENPGDPGAW